MQLFSIHVIFCCCSFFLALSSLLAYLLFFAPRMRECVCVSETSGMKKHIYNPLNGMREINICALCVCKAQKYGSEQVRECVSPLQGWLADWLHGWMDGWSFVFPFACTVSIKCALPKQRTHLIHIPNLIACHDSASANTHFLHCSTQLYRI